MRHVYVAAASWISLISLLVIVPARRTLGQGGTSGLSMDGNYQFVNQTRDTRVLWYVTYRAELQNTGAAVPNVVAKVTSLSPSVVTVPGQDTVHFGPVPANGVATSSDTFTILVDRSVNFSWSNLQWSIQSVQANAGPNQTVPVGSTVVLNGSGSTNPAGTGTLTYAWILVSTPTGSNATLLNSASALPSFVADTAGQYVAALTVTNGYTSSTANVTVSTVNSLPVADAGPNQTAKLNQAVTLDGSRSYDVDGNTLTYAWSLISMPTNSVANLGSSYTSVMPSFVPDLAGTYVAQLVVTDANGSSIPSTVTITTGNTAPVANAGPDQAVTAGATVQLNGARSTDVNGNPLTYEWSLIAKPDGSSATLSDGTAVNPTFVADTAGTYVAQLIVNDGKINSNPAVVVISTNVTLPPSANAGPPQSVPTGANVTLAGSGADPQNLALTYQWSLIAKPIGSIATLANATATNPTFVADQPGTYVAQLITNNGSENSVPATVAIKTGITAPVAVAGQDRNIAAGTLATLNGSGSYDPDRNLLTYSWSLLHVPANSNAVISNPTATSPTFLADVVGLYVAQLIVNNGTISSAPVTVAIDASVMRVTLTPTPLNLLLNATGTLTVNLSQPAPSGGVQVTLSGFDPNVISLPSTVTIAAKASSAPVTVTPLANGSTNVLATASGYQSGSASVTVTTPSIKLTLPSGVGVGHTVTGTFTLSAPAPASGTVVTLASTSPATVTSPVTVASGGTTGSFTVTGVSTGSATITATATAYSSGSANILVSQLGAIGLSAATVAPGQTVAFPVTLSSPAPVGGETITLVSSDPTTLTVTSPVVIPQGATKPTTQPTITGVAFGSATVTASGPGYASASQVVQVSAVLAFTPNSTTIGAGGSQNLTLSLSSTSASAIVVNLSSSNTAVAKVPASVTIPANATSVPVPVTAGSGGTATITASTSTPNIGKGTASITVTTFGGITAPSSLSVGLGQSSTLAIALSAAAPQGGVTVSLSSSDPTKVTVSPATVSIAAGQTQPATQPQVTGTGPGAATITASAPGYVSASTVVTTSASLSLTPQNVSIPSAGSQTMTVTLSGQAPSSGLVVNLTTTTPNVISVPASVTIQPNATTATFPAQAVGSGTTTLSASASIPNVSSANDSITVLSAQTIILPANVTVAPGQSVAFQVTLPAAAPAGGVSITLASSDSTKAAISPATVTIGQGQTQPATQPQLTGVNFGSATITASATGYVTGSQSVKVAASLSFSANSTNITGTSTQNLLLNLSAAAPSNLTINLSANPTGIITLPATVTILQGKTSVSIPVTGASTGTTTITASTTTTNVSSATTGVTVTSAGSIALPSGVTVGLGQSAPFQVTLSSAAPQGGTTVVLSSSNPSVVSISPSSVLIPAGATQPATAPQVTGVAPGSASITGSAATYTSATQSVAVSATIALTPQTPSIVAGQTQNLTLTLSGPAPAGGLTFNVASTNPAAGTVSASTVTVAASSTTATIPVKGVAAGTTTITVSAPNFTSATDVVTVTPALNIIVPATITVGPGANVSFPVTLAKAPTSNVTVTLVLSKPSLASLNFSNVSFNAGSTTPTRQPLLTGVSSGTLTITASAPGLTSAVSNVTVGIAATLTPANLTIIGTTGTGSLYINLSSPAQTTTTFTLTSSKPAVATVPGTERINAGAQSVGFAVTPLSLGTTTITATAPGFTPLTATVSVQNTAALSLSAPSNSLQLGGTETVTVGIPSPAQGGPVNVTLSSSSPSVTVSPTTVTISQNSSSATAQITGVNVGSANISASATNYTSPTPLAIQVSASVAWSAPTLTIDGNGKIGYLNLVLSGPVPTGSSGVAIALSSSNTAVATVPASVLFPVNSNAHPTLQIPITSVGPGTATIHASGTNIPDTTATVTVVGPLAINTTTLPNATAGASYSTTVQASGGVQPYTFSATGLPSNLSISSSGQITGTPQSPGTSQVSVTVTDSNTPTPASVTTKLTLVVNPPVPASIVASSGTPQSAQTATAFASPLVALVKDSSGNPVSGASVTFTAPASGASGSFPGGALTYTTSTNASGLATAGVFTANATAGPYSVLASVSGVTTPATFALTNVSRSAASVTATGGTPQSATVNTAFATALSAVVKDSLSNPISGVVVTFTAPASGASASLAGGVTTLTATTNASGVASVPVTANKMAGSYTVTATVTGLTPATFALTNKPGPAASITATAGATQSAKENNAFATLLGATVKDQYGNAVSGASVVFSAPTSGASGKFANNTTTTTATTNSSGIATATTFTANGTAGSYTVSATTAGVSTPATFALTNLQGAPGSITATGGTPQSTTVNTAFGTALAATVKDGNNNPVGNVTVTFTVNPATSGAGATFSGGVTTATATTNSSGVATITVTANKTAGAYSVQASTSGVSTPAAFLLTNTPGAAASITATSGSGQTATISTAFAAPLGATVKDQYGNPVSGASVTFTVVPNSGAGATFAGGAATYTTTTNAAGVATSTTVTANATKGSYSVTASTTGVSTPASFTLTNAPGTAASIVASSSSTPQNTTVNTAFGSPLAVTVKDSGGNPVSGASVTFTAPSSGASGTFAGTGAVDTVVTNTSGVATSTTFTANTTAGSYTVTATTGGLSTTFSLKNNPGPVAAVTVNAGSGQSATINTAYASPLKALVKDSFGNPISGVAVTFTLPTTGASGTFAGGVTTATTDSSGIATSAVLTASSVAGPFSVKAAVGSVSTTFSLTNNPGAPASVTVTGGSGQSATVNTAFVNPLVVVVKDAQQNVVPGVSVVFTAPTSGASGTFAGATNTVTVSTNSSGTATSPAFTANKIAGGYTVTAAVGSLSAPFSLTNTPGPAANITATAGSNQAAPEGSAFATNLQATVTDANNNPISGIAVTFTAPTGTNIATGTFAGNASTSTVSTNSSGVATAPVFTANSVSGGYAVKASINASVSTTFSLTNVVNGPAHITVVSGSGQTAKQNAPFAAPLQAKVTDGGNNGLRGITVTFTAPPIDVASGLFANKTNTTTAVTDSNGIATSSAFTANGTVGTYNVTASVSSNPPLSTNFTLTNAAGGQGGTITATNVTIGQDLEANILVTLNPPAPSSGLYLSYASSNPSQLLVGSSGTLAGKGAVVSDPNVQSNPNIPAGTQQFTIVAQALASSGTATVTFSAPGYDSGVATVTFARSGFVIAGPSGVGAPFNTFKGASTPLTVYSGYLDNSNAIAADQSVAGGLSISVPVSSSNTSVGTVSPGTASFTGGVQQTTVTFNASSTNTGTTNISVSQPAGFTPAASGTSVTATVQQASIIPFSTTIGNGLQQNETISLSGPAPAATNVTLTSPDNRVQFYCGSTPTSACSCGTSTGQACSVPVQSITLTIATGHSISPGFLVEGNGSAGTITYTASSSGLGTTNGTVKLAPAVLAIQSPGGFGASQFTAPLNAGPATLTVYTGYNSSTQGFVAENVADGNSVTVSLSNSNPSVATLSPTSLTIAGENGSGTATLTPQTTGSTTVNASAPNFTSAGVTGTFNQVKTYLSISGDNSTIGNNLASPYTVYLSSTPSSATTVQIQSNSNAALLATSPAGPGSTTLSLNVPANGSSANFYVIGAGNTGVATLTASASGYANGTTSVTLAPSAFSVIPPSLSGSAGTTQDALVYAVWLDNTNTPNYSDEVLAGSAAVSIPAGSSNTSVATVSSPLSFGAGQNFITLPINLVAAGTSTVTITEPSGFGQPLPNYLSTTVQVQ